MAVAKVAVAKVVGTVAAARAVARRGGTTMTASCIAGRISWVNTAARKNGNRRVRDALWLYELLLQQYLQ